MAELLPPVRARFFDANGNPLAGGKIYTYEAGTTTPLATYTDASAGTANTNPVILDANGEADIWLSNDVYKIRVDDANDVTLWTRDNIKGLGKSIADLINTEGALAAANNLSDLADPAAALTNLGLTATATELNYTSGVTSAIQTQLDAKASDADLTAAEERITEAEGDILQLQADVSTAQSTVNNHIADAADAHAASAISVTPSGNLAADDVQEALTELQTDIDTLDSDLDAHVNDATDAHDASAISYDNTSSGATATNVQDVIDEIFAEGVGGGGSTGVFPPIILRVNGRYSQLGAADDILRTTINFDINITGVRILIDKAGSAGDTEIDIKYKRGDGPWTSIFSVPPVANYADGDDFLSDSGTLDGTQGELKAGDIIRLDQLSVQTDGVGYLVRIDWNRTFTGGE